MVSRQTETLPKAEPIDELAQDNKVRLIKVCKWCGCAVKVLVLIRGDHFQMQC